MVVGGQANFVKEKLSKNLARHGIAVHTHLCWDKRRPPAKLPQDIDLVYVCTDMVSHSLSEPCMNYARELNIPYVNGTRKWAESIVRLTSAGFPLLNPSENLMDIIHEVVASRPPGTPPSDTDFQGIAVALTGDASRAADFDPQYNKQDSTVTVNLPAAVAAFSSKTEIANMLFPNLATAPAPDTAPRAAPVFTGASSPTHPRQAAYLRALIRSPLAPNMELWEDVKQDPAMVGLKPDNGRVSVARIQLGITVKRFAGKRIVDIDLEKFTDIAMLLKMNDCKIPEAHNEIIDPTQSISKPVVKEPVVVEETVVAAPAAPAVTAHADLTVIELVKLLKARMEVENYVELLLDEHGVQYRRVQVTEGRLEI
jgi:hypothetical protein